MEKNGKGGRPVSRAGKLWTMFWIMAKIGCFTFGGGWSIIVQIQHEFVDKRGWMKEEQIIDFMSVAKSLPGIMIVNMSVLCGYAMEGAAGALSAAFGLTAPAGSVFLWFPESQSLCGKGAQRSPVRGDSHYSAGRMEAEGKIHHKHDFLCVSGRGFCGVCVYGYKQTHGHYSGSNIWSFGMEGKKRTWYCLNCFFLL